MLKLLPVLSSWAEAIETDPYFAESETPCLVGRAVAALAADPNVGAKSGGVFATWTLSKEYGLTDVDGRRPDWGTFFPRKVQEIGARDEPTEMDLFIVRTRIYQATSLSSALGSTRRSSIRPGPKKPGACGPGSPVTTDQQARDRLRRPTAWPRTRPCPPPGL